MADAPQEPTYESVAREFAAPLQRLAIGYEADAERQRDLLQEMHLALWRALPSFEGRASLRTFVHRVAHNVAVGYVIRSSRDQLSRCVPLEEMEERAAHFDGRQIERRDEVERLAMLVRSLRPNDRQIILLYLEGFGHAEIGEVCGISPENAATKVHRIKRALAAALEPGDGHGQR